MAADTEIANNLGTIRKLRGLSAAALAKLAGVSRQTIYAMERGGFVPNTMVALKLARALESTVEEIFALAETGQRKDREVRRAVVVPGSDQIEAGQPLQLCLIKKRLVASSPAPAPWYFPASDGIAAAIRKAKDGLEADVQTYNSPDEWRRRIVVAGCDPGMSVLARHALSAGLEIVLAHRNSSQSLALLRRGIVHVAGTHLRDQATGESNIPEIRRLFQRNSVTVISFAVWEEGILTAKGNPKAIRTIEDLCRSDVQMVNREAGAGSRLLLDFHLKRLKINAHRLRGYTDIAIGHLPAAWQVRSGLCDCCIATRGAARVVGLDFVPLTSERFDLVMLRDHVSSPGIQVLLETLNRSRFRRELESVGGYDTSSTGSRIL